MKKAPQLGQRVAVHDQGGRYEAEVVHVDDEQKTAKVQNPLKSPHWVHWAQLRAIVRKPRGNPFYVSASQLERAFQNGQGTVEVCFLGDIWIDSIELAFIPPRPT